MYIRIDPSNGVPIYLQIIQEIKMLIAAGSLIPGDKMPSVRNLAMELRVNPNTIAKAYNELEREGVIFTKRGEGTFVSNFGNDVVESSKLDLLREKIDEVTSAAYRFGISREKLHGLIDESYNYFREERE